jgi:hypothetical protein
MVYFLMQLALFQQVHLNLLKLNGILVIEQKNLIEKSQELKELFIKENEIIM